MLQTYPNDPAYAFCDVAVLMTCAENIAVHTKEHNYPPKYILLKDEEFAAYLSFYTKAPEVPTFLGIPVQSGKA